MNNNVSIGGGQDLINARKCNVHGLFFDPSISHTCPLCEFERADRIAGIRLY